jgi:peptide/nickel transport system substrate-binding protein
MTLSRRAFLAVTGAATAAAALGRTPYGGKLALSVPWPTGSIDPHALDDAAAALFGPAIADPLYAIDSRGQPYPTLASSLPEATQQGARVRLRALLNTARGKAIDARDLLWSLARSRQRGGAAVLSAFTPPVADGREPLAVLFPGADPAALARALSSPLTAVLPKGFSPARPDATGAFLAEPGPRQLILKRNLKAARGAAFLDSVEVTAASDLAAALRAFEAGDADVGWLGAGLHRPRPGAVSFDAGRLGWVVLRTGGEAGSWGAAGVAQRLLDGLPPSRVAHLGLHGVAGTAAAATWGGSSCELLVTDDSPHLLEIAKTLGAHLSAPGHEVTAAVRTAAELRRVRSSGRFSLLLDLVRPVGPTEADTVLAVLAAADPNLAQHPPKLPGSDPRRLTQTLTLGIVGELRIEGAREPTLVGIEGWNLGEVWRRVG